MNAFVNSTMRKFKKNSFILTFLFLSSFYNSVFSYYEIKAAKNILYQPDTSVFLREKFNTLDIYYPTDKTKPKHVFVFIYGGFWHFGDKSQFALLGRNFAKRGIVTVCINFRQIPQVDMYDQLKDCALAMLWVKDNIAEFGGNPEKIVVGGHSSGGHASALLSWDKRYYNYFNRENPAIGLIQLDGAALELKSFIPGFTDRQHQKIKMVFTDQIAIWEKYNPYNYLQFIDNSVLFLNVQHTYPEIKKSYDLLKENMKTLGIPYDEMIIKNQTHVLFIYTLIFNRNYSVTNDIAKYIKSL